MPAKAPVTLPTRVAPSPTVHNFWNAGPTLAKLLVIFSPPGFEQSFVEVFGERGEEEEIDHATYVERIMAVSETKYNQEIVGPPLG